MDVIKLIAPMRCDNILQHHNWRRTSTLTGTAGGPSAAFSPAPELPSDGALFAPSPAEGGGPAAAAADSEPSPAESVFAFFGSGSPEDVDGPAAKAALSASAFLANSSLWKKDEMINCSKILFCVQFIKGGCFVHACTDDARLGPFSSPHVDHMWRHLLLSWETLTDQRSYWSCLKTHISYPHIYIIVLDL